MKNSLTIICCIFLFNGSLIAKGDLFSVILNQGDNTISSNRGNMQAVVGAKINANDVVEVEKGGYVALLHASGGNLEIKKGGTYTTDQLIKMVSANESSLLNKYGMYLMSKLNPREGTGDNLNITGAVERGNAALINVHMPRTMDVYGDRAVITWDDSNENRKFLVTVKNMFDEVIYEKVTAKAVIELNFNGKDLKGNTLLILNVRDQDNEYYRSREYGIKKISNGDATKIKKDLNTLEAVASEKESINKILIASFFEENGLLIDASTCYNDAIALEPKVEDYKNLYELFLERNAMINSK